MESSEVKKAQQPKTKQQNKRVPSIMNKLLSFMTTIAALTLISGAANAVPVIYTGSDSGVGAGGPRPNSDGAAASFDTAAAGMGTVNLIDMESLSTGYSASIGLDSNVTATYAGDIDTNPTLSGIVSSDDTILGYNTTAGGTKHLRMSPTFGWNNASLTLSFTDSISSFGAYFTGLEASVNGTIDVLFDDGSLNSYALPINATAGVTFWGFTDMGMSIDSIVFNEINTGGGTRDIWGMDDIRYVAASVPEPAALALFGIGLIGLGFARRS